jgi:hypothetical protein
VSKPKPSLSISRLISIIGRFHGTPISAWLRVPLDWYQSSTRSFFEGESHSSIRRSFSPRHAPQTQRIFCGFCGTPLTFWTEEPLHESEFMSISIGSLLIEDQRALDDLGLLPEDFDDEEAPRAGVSLSERAPAQTTSSSVIIPSFEDSTSFPDISTSLQRGRTGGIPWFEEMMEGSRLGRLMRSRRGMGISDDQSTSIQWEFSEWHDDGTGGIVQQDSDSSGRSRAKRKRVTRADAEIQSPSKRVE